MIEGLKEQRGRKRMILFINACVRKGSRTRRLADALLSKWTEPATEVRLSDIDFPVTSEDYLSRRDRLIAAEKFSDPMFDRRGGPDRDRGTALGPFFPGVAEAVY